MNISKEYRVWLEENFGKDIILKENRIISLMTYEAVNPEKIVIPSKMYPLKGEGDIEIFTTYNTKKLDGNQIKNIYDGTEFKQGNCYSNSYRLWKNLRNAGINDVSSYVGWFYNCTNDRPVHHCAIVYKGIYMLDMSSDSDIEELKTVRANSKDEIREILAKRYVDRLNNMSASERSCFGDMMPESLFIAKRLEPEEGAKFFFEELIKIYPDHPSYRNIISPNGATKTQLMIQNLLKKLSQWN